MPPGDRDIFGCVGERAKCAPLRWHVRFVSSHTGADFAQAAITEAARRALVFAALLEPPGADKPPGADAPRPADCADGGAGADEDGADEEGADASLNAAQRRAVSAITGPRSQNGGCVLLFGPPGTGKTKTVVAAIDAVLRRKPHARVLACAPSDEAADLLATRLLGCGSAAIAAARVVVSTCGCAGLLLLAQLGGGHFTHIVVDEAAQALEPECLCALALAGPETRVALSGDPWQLGPHVASRAAMQLGLGKSLLQRLMEQRESAGNGATVVRLCENYRAHAALLEVPSRLFYASKLREAADRDVTSSLLPWEHGGFALLTWGVCGRHMRELDSPSFFNPLEAHKVAELISLLVRSKTVQCEPKDVGVLCAFRKQVLKLRTLLRSLGLGAVSVGQVYDFQGAEMRVVIVSTTLSSRPFVGTASAVDGAALPPIGLLDARRFNVAITRAKALCIVVGHPHLLMTEPYWCDLVKYCQDHDAYRGASLDDLDTDTPRPADCARCPGDDDGGAESVVDRASALLGSADFDVMYPTDLHTIYSSESSWRIIL
ncbi:P-loop containing nucleoside triphosphate hydrolase protein [Pelagophyceae sp. CCMP2097]|nr:P-loop containing nucleoside triphosphate hydrolase protein [Pelagophyceae sp. CCMP2097]